MVEPSTDNRETVDRNHPGVPNNQSKVLWSDGILIGRELDCESGKCEFEARPSPQSILIACIV